jgi:nucleoside-diphosphate-sugar epimerase
MNDAEWSDFIVGPDALSLVRGATGFIGPSVVRSLLHRGFRRIRCFVRPSAKTSKVATLCNLTNGSELQMFRGILLSMEDCVLVIVPFLSHRHYPAA